MIKALSASQDKSSARELESEVIKLKEENDRFQKQLELILKKSSKEYHEINEELNNHKLELQKKDLLITKLQYESSYA